MAAADDHRGKQEDSSDDDGSASFADGPYAPIKPASMDDAVDCETQRRSLAANFPGMTLAPLRGTADGKFLSAPAPVYAEAQKAQETETELERLAYQLLNTPDAWVDMTTPVVIATPLARSALEEALALVYSAVTVSWDEVSARLEAHNTELVAEASTDHERAVFAVRKGGAWLMLAYEEGVVRAAALRPHASI